LLQERKNGDGDFLATKQQLEQNQGFFLFTLSSGVSEENSTESKTNNNEPKLSLSSAGQTSAKLAKLGRSFLHKDPAQAKLVHLVQLSTRPPADEQQESPARGGQLSIGSQAGAIGAPVRPPEEDQAESRSAAAYVKLEAGQRKAQRVVVDEKTPLERTKTVKTVSVGQAGGQTIIGWPVELPQRRRQFGADQALHSAGGFIVNGEPEQAGQREQARRTAKRAISEKLASLAGAANQPPVAEQKSEQKQRLSEALEQTSAASSKASRLGELASGGGSGSSALGAPLDSDYNETGFEPTSEQPPGGEGGQQPAEGGDNALLDAPAGKAAARAQSSAGGRPAPPSSSASLMAPSFNVDEEEEQRAAAGRLASSRPPARFPAASRVSGGHRQTSGGQRATRDEDEQPQSAAVERQDSPDLRAANQTATSGRPGGAFHSGQLSARQQQGLEQLASANMIASSSTIQGASSNGIKPVDHFRESEQAEPAEEEQRVGATRLWPPVYASTRSAESAAATPKSESSSRFSRPFGGPDANAWREARAEPGELATQRPSWTGGGAAKMPPHSNGTSNSAYPRAPVHARARFTSSLVRREQQLSGHQTRSTAAPKPPRAEEAAGSGALAERKQRQAPERKWTVAGERKESRAARTAKEPGQQAGVGERATSGLSSNERHEQGPVQLPALISEYRTNFSAQLGASLRSAGVELAAPKNSIPSESTRAARPAQSGQSSAGGDAPEGEDKLQAEPGTRKRQPSGKPAEAPKARTVERDLVPRPAGEQQQSPLAVGVPKIVQAPRLAPAALPPPKTDWRAPLPAGQAASKTEDSGRPSVGLAVVHLGGLIGQLARPNGQTGAHSLNRMAADEPARQTEGLVFGGQPGVALRTGFIQMPRPALVAALGGRSLGGGGGQANLGAIVPAAMALLAQAQHSDSLKHSRAIAQLRSLLAQTQAYGALPASAFGAPTQQPSDQLAGPPANSSGPGSAPAASLVEQQLAGDSQQAAGQQLTASESSGYGSVASLHEFGAPSALERSASALGGPNAAGQAEQAAMEAPMGSHPHPHAHTNQHQHQQHQMQHQQQQQQQVAAMQTGGQLAEQQQAHAQQAPPHLSYGAAAVGQARRPHDARLAFAASSASLFGGELEPMQTHLQLHEHSPASFYAPSEHLANGSAELASQSRSSLAEMYLRPGEHKISAGGLEPGGQQGAASSQVRQSLDSLDELTGGLSTSEYERDLADLDDEFNRHIVSFRPTRPSSSSGTLAGSMSQPLVSDSMLSFSPERYEFGQHRHAYSLRRPASASGYAHATAPDYTPTDYLQGSGSPFAGSLMAATSQHQAQTAPRAHMLSYGPPDSSELWAADSGAYEFSPLASLLSPSQYSYSRWRPSPQTSAPSRHHYPAASGRLSPYTVGGAYGLATAASSEQPSGFGLLPGAPAGATAAAIPTETVSFTLSPLAAAAAAAATALAAADKTRQQAQQQAGHWTFSLPRLASTLAAASAVQQQQQQPAGATANGGPGPAGSAHHAHAAHLPAGFHAYRHPAPLGSYLFGPVPAIYAIAPPPPMHARAPVSQVAQVAGSHLATAASAASELPYFAAQPTAATAGHTPTLFAYRPAGSPLLTTASFAYPIRLPFGAPIYASSGALQHAGRPLALGHSPTSAASSPAGQRPSGSSSGPKSAYSDLQFAETKPKSNSNTSHSSNGHKDSEGTKSFVKSAAGLGAMARNLTKKMFGSASQVKAQHVAPPLSFGLADIMAPQSTSNQRTNQAAASPMAMGQA